MNSQWFMTLVRLARSEHTQKIMCHALHLLADADLPLAGPHDPNSLSLKPSPFPFRLAVAGLPEGLACCYVGSTSGCSCDFYNQDSHLSRTSLTAYIGRLPAGVRCWIYDCWEGDQGLPPESSTTVHFSELANVDTYAERRLLAVTRAP